MKRTFFITTFGCRTNQADSAGIRSALQENGCQEVDSPEKADVIIVNSCTVTHRSDQQVRQLTRKLSRKNPGARIVLTGCYAQRDPGMVRQIEGVTLVAGNSHKDQLAGLLATEEDLQAGQVRVFRENLQKARTFSPLSALPIGEKTRPLVKIQDGCDAKCSYCIVPAVRGPSRSVPADLVVKQIRGLLDQGFREIVLTGIHMGTYGMYLKPRVTLDKLIERISRLSGDWRLRLSSIEPMELSRRIIDLAVSSKRVASHFHICLQSGSDRILRKMLRPYNTTRFASLVEEIHRKIPQAGIGTDVICGFPGENEEDHRETLQFLQEMPFTYFHVFPYSDRSGTAASQLPDKVPPQIIKERSRELRGLSDRKNQMFRKSLIGKKVSVVTLSESDDGYREALTDHYLKVRVPRRLPENQLHDFEVLREEDGFLICA